MINDFEYHAPKTLKEALALLDKYEDSKVICGGQSLLILMRQGLVAPENLIDIKGVAELDYIKKDSKTGGVNIGATTTHRTIEQSTIVKKAIPVLAQMEKRLASTQTRNRGSIGGNVCHGDPAGDPAPVLIALGASLKLSSVKGDRIMKIDKFYKDYFETELAHNELLTEIQIPAVEPFTGSVYYKFNIIQTDMATVSTGVTVTLASATGACKDVRIAIGGCSPTAVRAIKAENVLRGNKITDKLMAEAGEIAATECEPISDIFASADYRKELVKVLVKRYCAEALARAKA